jgi:hypothetical protein
MICSRRRQETAISIGDEASVSIFASVRAQTVAMLIRYRAHRATAGPADE